METIHLEIPNMKNTHCQMTVSDTVKKLGAEIKSIAPAQLDLSLTEGLTKQTVVDAIEKAGYTVSNK